MEPLLVSLLAAAESAPSDVPLRLHLAELLQQHGEPAEAVRHCAAALAIDPTSEPARALMGRLLGVESDDPASQGNTAPVQGHDADHSNSHPHGQGEEHPTPPHRPVGQAYGVVQAPVDDSARQEQDSEEGGDDDRDDLWAERVNVTLADIGGMETAKERLEAAVLAPMRNPELRRLYRQSRTGGVLLYGPPGCGKVFLARATAGELDVRFLSLVFDRLSLEEQVDEIGAVFQAAREQAPVVLCLVGVEHLGSRSMAQRAASARSVSALASELDKGPEGNLGVTIMGTTNLPWEVDPVLRRPGRLEQTLLVLPPDRTTREVVLRQQLGDHPEVDVAKIARRSSGYSGRDLAVAVRTAEEMNSPVTTQDVLDALTAQPPSARAWLATAARETATLPDQNAYLGLREYLATRGAVPLGGVRMR